MRGRCFIEWQEQLAFCFPPALGQVVEVCHTQIAVNWEQAQQHVHGLYIVKAKVRFDLQPTTATAGILMEHLDLEEDVAYFEYGVPFERIIEQPVQQLLVQQLETKAEKTLVIQWEMHAEFVPLISGLLLEEAGIEHVLGLQEQFVREDIRLK